MQGTSTGFLKCRKFSYYVSYYSVLYLNSFKFSCWNHPEVTDVIDISHFLFVFPLSQKIIAVVLCSIYQYIVLYLLVFRFLRAYCRMCYKAQLMTWESKLKCNCLKMFATTNFRVHAFLLFSVLVFCLNLWRVVPTKWTFISILCFFT